jgi:hypothetical protein
MEWMELPGIWRGYLQIFFLVNGLILFLFSITKSITIRTNGNQFLFIAVCIISGFIIFFAPFIATRHILLIIPFILILFHSQNIEISKINKSLGIVISVVLCVTIVNADYTYASYYKHQAKEIATSVTGNKYTIGHWGWQWYARQNGMKIYDKQSDSLQLNDLIIVPKDIAKQGIAENLELTLMETIIPSNNSHNPFSVSNHGSFYNSFIDKPVWTFSSQPLDSLCVYKVTKVND